MKEITLNDLQERVVVAAMSVFMIYTGLFFLTQNLHFIIFIFGTVLIITYLID